MEWLLSVGAKRDEILIPDGSSGNTEPPLPPTPDVDTADDKASD